MNKEMINTIVPYGYLNNLEFSSYFKFKNTSQMKHAVRVFVQVNGKDGNLFYGENRKSKLMKF